LHEGVLQAQGAPEQFWVKPVDTAAPNTDFQAVSEFQQATSELSRQISGAGRQLGEAGQRLRHMQEALTRTPKAAPELFSRVTKLEKQLSGLRMRLSGDPARQRMNEATVPSIASRVGEVIYGHWETRQMPTEAHRRNIEIAKSDFDKFQAELKGFFQDLEGVEAALEAAGAPYTPGRKF
jgi:hypothetical protein